MSQSAMKQRLIASGVVFVVGFGIGLGVTWALLAKKPTPPAEVAEGDADGYASEPEPGDGDEPSDGSEAGATEAAGAAGTDDGATDGEADERAGGPEDQPGTGADGAEQPGEGTGGDPDPIGAKPEADDGTDAAKPGTDPSDGDGPGNDGADDGADGAENGNAGADGPGEEPGEKPAETDGSENPADAPVKTGHWWEGLSGKTCRVDLGRARALTIREGELKDGDVLDWKAAFGRNRRIGSLFKDDESIVTVHGVAVNGAGTPVAAHITLDKKGRETTGIIALHTQGLKVTLYPVDAK